MSFKKDDKVTFVIEDIGTGGEGIGKVDGYTLFVKDAIIGDKIEAKIIKAKKNYGYARLEKIIEASSDRVTPACPVARQCGGCQIQQMSYQAQLRFKEKLVDDNLKRIGKIEGYEFFPAIGMEEPFRYRNKAQYPVGTAKDGSIVMGFYAGRTHSIISCTDCKIGAVENQYILAVIKSWMEFNGVAPYDEQTGRGLVRHVLIRTGFHTDEIMVCLVITDLKKRGVFDVLVGELCKKYADIKSIVFNENSRKTNCILGQKLVTAYGSDTIHDTMCGNDIEISPLSFYQVNTIQAERLYEIAADYAQLTGKETLLDLYCGAGTIGLSMSKKVKKLIGVEIIESAIDNAKRNAAANNVTNAEFICGDAGKIAAILYSRGERPDVIIADPARKGCTRDALEYMAKMSPDRIVMISCNHATAARDCAVLEELEYKTVKVKGVDLFGRTGHVETVCLLSRKDK